MNSTTCFYTMRRWLFLLAVLLPVSVAAQNDLPTLGDTSSGIISLEQERKLGQQFLRSIRAQAPTLDDAILQDYIEHLVYRRSSVLERDHGQTCIRHRCRNAQYRAGFRRRRRYGPG